MENSRITALICPTSMIMPDNRKITKIITDGPLLSLSRIPARARFPVQSKATRAKTVMRPMRNHYFLAEIRMRRTKWVSERHGVGCPYLQKSGLDVADHVKKFKRVMYSPVSLESKDISHLIYRIREFFEQDEFSYHQNSPRENSNR